jgi:predicted transposase YbfD/YdcC
MLNRLRACFAELRDPRCAPGERYDLAEILIIALCAVLSGGNSAVDMALYGRAKREFLHGFLELRHGVPSHDTFSRVFRRLDPDQFRACFQRFVAGRSGGAGRIIAIDGKAAHGGRLHMVSAWDCERQQVLAQIAIDKKSGEAAAIDELLRQLPLAGTTVTADALNCQRSLAQRIVARGGDYVLALKANHRGLYALAKQFLDDLCPDSTAIDTTITTNHGRNETRTSLVSADLGWLPQRFYWPGLAALGKVVRTRGPSDPMTGDESIEAAYFLLSVPLSAKAFAAAVRAHWGVENHLHWPLNAVMHESHARNRCDNSPYNLAILRHMALNLMHKDGSPLSLRSKFNRAGWEDGFLAKLLEQTEGAAAAATPRA